MAGSVTIIEQKIKALQDFQNTANERVIRVCKQFEPEIVDMNTAQLYAGLDSLKKPIEPGYRPFTVSIKRAKGQPTDRVTLKDTGDFYGAFFVNFGAEYLAIGSNDEKALKLERKYGKDIYGLTDDDQDELCDMVRPELREDFMKLVI